MVKNILALAAACAAVGAMTGAAARDAGGAPSRSPLASHLASPEPAVIARFEAAGMRDVRPHALTPAERTRVEAALAALPALHRAVLGTRLRRLSLVDGIPGEGTGLTSRVEGADVYDITLRASLLEESLSTFLTAKERRVFGDDGSRHTVGVDATGADALDYVLLHEATHVVDAAMGITARLDGPFEQGIWEGRTALAPSFAASAAAATPFRGSAPVPVGGARTVYDALARTPFVSLYATAAAPEDFAELVTWRVLAQRYGSAPTITVSDADGKPLQRYRPLDFPGVAARMDYVEGLLRRAAD